MPQKVFSKEAYLFQWQPFLSINYHKLLHQAFAVALRIMPNNFGFKITFHLAHIAQYCCLHLLFAAR